MDLLFESIEVIELEEKFVAALQNFPQRECETCPFLEVEMIGEGMLCDCGNSQPSKCKIVNGDTK